MPELIKTQYVQASCLVDWGQLDDFEEQLFDHAIFTQRPFVIDRQRLRESVVAQDPSQNFFYSIDFGRLPENLRRLADPLESPILKINQTPKLKVFYADAAFYYGNGCTDFVPKGSHHVIDGDRVKIIYAADRLLVDDEFEPESLKDFEWLENWVQEP